MSFDVGKEERWSRGTWLGEAVWSRLCRAADRDPKDPQLQQERAQLVHAVRDAAFAMDEAGIDGLADWLDLESWAEMKGGAK